ncbi:MAG: DsrH/TusB family sulfur relay protein [Alphaproteobacteria bacterium]|uniref:DsrH/TusB family sulfur relay protein n=1 Tax=Candidatus Nitrobium versatile TaxID=2884831 RepID=A0A953J8N4_9BACT|nr:DsrH/TusB family sulfur relay protein [Candidatus Nitrobium versatile]
MLVLVKSAPDTVDGKRGVKLARDMAADLVFLQNGVYFAQNDMMEGFCGTAYVLEEDCRLRGLGEADLEKDIRKLAYEDLIDLMSNQDKVVGIF